MIPWLVGGAAALNASLAAQVATMTGRTMLTTGPGKRFLLAASNLDARSPSMAKLMRRIEQAMPKLGGAAAAQVQNAAPLDVEVTGGMPGPVPSEEELEALRVRVH